MAGSQRENTDIKKNLYRPAKNYTFPKEEIWRIYNIYSIYKSEKILCGDIGSVGYKHKHKYKKYYLITNKSQQNTLIKASLTLFR